jgi:hypothetical protein
MNWNRFSQELKGGCGLLACSLSFLFGSLDTYCKSSYPLSPNYFTGVLGSSSSQALEQPQSLEGIAKKSSLDLSRL